MTVALFAGSFDPVTNGHLDIIKSGAEIFSKLIVAVAYNNQKQGIIPIEKRVELLSQSVSDYSNVEVLSYKGLTVDFALKHGVNVLLRGLRNSKDFEYEKDLEQINSKLEGSIKSVYLICKPENSCISSSAVREIWLNKGDLSGFVPPNVEKYLMSMVN